VNITVYVALGVVILDIDCLLTTVGLSIDIWLTVLMKPAALRGIMASTD
jgi:hypothetical protein